MINFKFEDLQNDDFFDLNDFRINAINKSNWLQTAFEGEHGQDGANGDIMVLWGLVTGHK